jgi:7,8-dihydropterin-6-yl-methyl-4-(beta-D-ribofuranosyl)aminobenzene 5'-phosphate synthase
VNNDGVVLSHGHYDHTGGLPAVLGEAPQARVFLHPAALDSKFIAHSDGSSRFVGMPEASRAAFERNPTNRVETKGCTEVVTGLVATEKYHG